MKAKYLIILLSVIIALQACKDKKLPKTDPERIIDISEQWNRFLDNGNTDSLSFIYADSVLLYGEKLSKEQAVARKSAFISKHPDFKHVIDNVSTIHVDDNIYKTTFTKKVKYGDNDIDVNALLLFQKRGDKWVIISESDEPTEIKLEEQARKAEEAARRIQNLTFEQKVTLAGILGTTDYIDASGNKYTVYILTLSKPVNVKAPNKYYDNQTDVKEIQVGFSDAEDPQSLIGETITISGEIYGEDTIHDRRPVVMINAVIQKNK